MNTSLLDKEIGGLCVNIKHGVEFFLRSLDDRLAQDFSDGIHCNVDTAKPSLRFGEDGFDNVRLAEITLQGKCIPTDFLNRRDRLVRRRTGSFTMVMDNDVRTMFC